MSRIRAERERAGRVLAVLERVAPARARAAARCACPDAPVRELEGRASTRPSPPGLGQQALDRQLEVVHVLEAEVGALGDAAHDQPHDRPERPVQRRLEGHAVSHRPRHGAPPDHQVAVHQARGLARGGRRHLAAELERQRAMRAGAARRHRARHRAARGSAAARDVAARAGPVQHAPAPPPPAGAQRAARAHHHAVARARPWPARRAARGRPRRCRAAGPTVKRVVAVVAAEHAAVAVHDLAARGRRAQRAPPWRRMKRAARWCRPGSTGPGSRACRPPAARRRGPARARAASRARPSGKRSRSSSSPVEPGEHVALVLARGRRRRAPAGPRRRRRCARSGRWPAARRPAAPASSSMASKRTRPLQRTHGLGVAPPRVAGQEVVHHVGAEALAQVEREVRDAHPVRQRAGAGHRLRRAAARSPSVPGSDHSSSVTATTSSPASSASCAAAALSTPPLMATSVRSARGGSRSAPSRAASPSARCSASAARSAACAAAGESPPSSSAIAAGRHARGVAARGSPSTSSTAALPAARAAAQPLASKPASATRSPSTRTETRTRSPQAAPPAAPVCGERASAPRPRGALEVVAQGRRSCGWVRAAMGSAIGSGGLQLAAAGSGVGPAICKLGCPPDVPGGERLARPEPDSHPVGVGST